MKSSIFLSLGVVSAMSGEHVRLSNNLLSPDGFADGSPMRIDLSAHDLAALDHKGSDTIEFEDGLVESTSPGCKRPITQKLHNLFDNIFYIHFEAGWRKIHTKFSGEPRDARKNHGI